MPTAFQLLAAPHTPFHRDGSLNLAVVPQQSDLFRRTGVTGVFACGTTGEGLSLTVAERKAVAEAWVDASGGNLRVLVHVGHNCQRDAIELAAHAKGIGANGVAALAPHFLKPATPADLVAFLAPVAAACAPQPFFYYDLPSLTNVRLSAATVLDLGAKVMPNLAGVKYTNGDAVTLQECLTAAGGRMEVAGGVEEMLLASLALGIRTAVGSTFNFTSKLHRQIVEAFDVGDLARARQSQRASVAVVRVLEAHGGAVRAGKAAMPLFGIDCGPVRSPLAEMGAEETKALHAELKAIEPFAAQL